MSCVCLAVCSVPSLLEMPCVCLTVCSVPSLLEMLCVSLSVYSVPSLLEMLCVCFTVCSVPSLLEMSCVCFAVSCLVWLEWSMPACPQLVLLMSRGPTSFTRKNPSLCCFGFAYEGVRVLWEVGYRQDFWNMLPGANCPLKSGGGNVVHGAYWWLFYWWLFY
jgi:hypothetical protein